MIIDGAVRENERKNFKLYCCLFTFEIKYTQEKEEKEKHIDMFTFNCRLE